MDELKVIAWCLDAAGGVLREEGFRLLYAKNDELIEELWDTMGVLDIPRVGGDIKSGAPAAYLWFGTSEDDEEDKRVAFSVTHDDTLRYFTYNNYKDDWEESDFSELGQIQLAPGSGLTGGLGPDGPAIFSSTIIMKRGRWELGDLGGFVDPTPRVGSPLSITPVKEGIMVFFIGEDNALHYLAEDPQTGTWRDHWLDQIIMEAPVSRFKVFYHPYSKLFEAYFLSEGKLIRFASKSGDFVEGGDDEEDDDSDAGVHSDQDVHSDEGADSGEIVGNGKGVDWISDPIEGSEVKVEVGTMNGRRIVKNKAGKRVRDTFLADLITRTPRAYGLKPSEKTTRTVKTSRSSTTYISRTYPF
ncbi:hypothetical protein N7513_006109 [Penicillium frequentans]|nr:hypothetical protein N7513_006109 [Penicillium glabrum]